MKPGDLVLYKNEWNPTRIGLIIYEQHDVSLDRRYFRVMLEDGVLQMISEHYLDVINETR